MNWRKGSSYQSEHQRETCDSRHGSAKAESHCYDSKPQSQDVVSFGATVSAFEKTFRWQQGLLLLNLFAARTLRLNAVACSAAIGACEKAQLQLAMENASKAFTDCAGHVCSQSLPKITVTGLAKPSVHEPSQHQWEHSPAFQALR